MSGVRDEDKGYADLVKTIFALGAPKVSVGIHEADGQHEAEGGSGLRVIDVAQIHEFGLGVPERSFIRAWFDENEDKAKEAMRRLLVSVVKGERKPEQAVELFAQWVVGQMQARIAKGISPPLATSTVLRKGSSVPLIHTGQLRSSISYEIYNADGSLKKRGTSEAAVKRVKDAKAAKAAAKKQERDEARQRARERKAIRKEVASDVKSLAKGAKREVSRAAKNAQKAAKQAAKRAAKNASTAAKDAQRAAKKAAKQATRAAKRANRGVTRAAKKTNRTVVRAAKTVKRLAKKATRRRR